ncbi:hypothetical protein M413DRAFT_30929 [Hebeloma cylindrosporum]|uniref:Uncharacterized protein n=1 Tax=Hebeloma cylindrosporum TaxID=76867 RepID=A0A0C2Y8V6_HEBCY|nr:hypothetical protein M413DRAFT_30929 [Hebeloma cylindrosporum h7]
MSLQRRSFKGFVFGCKSLIYNVRLSGSIAHEEAADDRHQSKLESATAEREVLAHEVYEELLQNLLSEDKVHLHFIPKRPEYHTALKHLETESETPLDCQTPAFKALGTKWSQVKMDVYSAGSLAGCAEESTGSRLLYGAKDDGDGR